MITGLWARTDLVPMDEILRRTDANTQMRVKSCIRKNKSEEIALGRFLARTVLARLLSVDYEEVLIRTDSNGRPYTDDGKHFISISHSKGYCIAVVSDNPVGCDIEEIKAFRGEAIKAFFTEEDFEYIKNAEEPDQTMTEIWCIKESIYKHKGQDYLKNNISLNDLKKVEEYYNLKIVVSSIEKMICVISHEDEVASLDSFISKWN